LLRDVRAADCVSGVEQFLLHLLLLAFDPVHAVLVLVELGRCRPPPSAVGAPNGLLAGVFSHVFGQAVLGCQPFPTFWALKLRSSMSRHVILQVGCRRTRFLANVALVSVRKVIQVDVSQPRLPAVKRLVTVLALQVQGLSLVNHLDVLPEIQGLAETLGAVITHEAALMSRLFVLFQCRAPHKFPATSGMVTLELPEVVVYGFHVVPEVVQALQHQTTFITSLRLLLW